MTINEDIHTQVISHWHRSCCAISMGRIAIIDDSADTLAVFTVMLGDHHEFYTFASGEEFLKQFRSGSLDLILLDIAMPRMDGFEVLKRIQALDKDVPVTAITALAFEEERRVALAAGFCDYFVKPIMEIERFRQAVYSTSGKCSNPAFNPQKKDPAA